MLKGLDDLSECQDLFSAKFRSECIWSLWLHIILVYKRVGTVFVHVGRSINYLEGALHVCEHHPCSLEDLLTNS